MSQTLVRVLTYFKNCLKPFLADPILERLILMLALTQPCRDLLPGVHRAYLKHLWHYVAFRGSRIDAWSSSRTSKMFSEAINTVADLRHLASLLKIVF
jgi:hypothetical protein